MNILAEACSETVRQFDGQGWHRTATSIDRQSGEWLCERLRAFGVDAHPISFPFSRIDLSEASVSAGGVTVPAVPLLDSGLPAADSVIAGAFEPGNIGLIRTEAHGSPVDWGAETASDFRALVVAIDGAPGGVALLNAWKYDEPTEVPIVQVPGEAWDALARARDGGLPVEVRCGGTRVQTTADNIFARVGGSRPDLAPIVVLTPRSGWWNCAGERGGGLAIWVEAARVARTLALKRDLVFLATTGHEIGYLGVQRYLDADPALATGAVGWIHLGANIGAAGARLMIRASDAAMLSIAKEKAPAFGAITPLPTYSIADRPVGEAGEVGARGGRFVSLVGAGFPLFHSTLDRWPQAIDARAIASAADGVLQVIEEFDRQD